MTATLTTDMSTTTIRVLIADDHTLVRQGLRRLLEAQRDIEVVGEAGDGPETVRAVVERNPDVVLLDLTMPGSSGAQLVRRVRAQAPGVKVVVLTVHETEEFVSEALRAGAAGYVLKEGSSEELLAALRAVMQDEVYLSPSVARLVTLEGGDPRRVRTLSQRLTAREREVCRYLAQGYTVPETAALLGISRKTVDVHKTRLMRKLGVHNRADLVKYAIANKLV
ncbi:MAG: DNA-binding response regulator [Planctomycetota bacterium]|nr:MAG: DNA-binding response regulator [Planctomycetota bacterium]